MTPAEDSLRWRTLQVLARVEGPHAPKRRPRVYGSPKGGRSYAYYRVLRWYACGCHIRQRVYQGGYTGREQIVWCRGCYGHWPQEGK